MQFRFADHGGRRAHVARARRSGCRDGRVRPTRSSSWQRHAVRRPRGDRALRELAHTPSTSSARNIIEDRFDALLVTGAVRASSSPDLEHAVADEPLRERSMGPAHAGALPRGPAGRRPTARTSGRAARPGVTSSASNPARRSETSRRRSSTRTTLSSARGPGRRHARRRVPGRARPRGYARCSAVRPSSPISPRCGTRRPGGHGGLVSVIGARRHRQDPARRRAGEHGARTAGRSSRYARCDAVPPTRREPCSTRRCARPAAP